MFKKIIFLGLSLCLAACSQSGTTDKATEESTQKQILALHDQLMSKMDKLENLKNKLKNPHLGSNPQFKDQKDTLALFNNYQDTYKLLDSGDRSMMDWMSQFQMDYKAKTHAETMIYLNHQLKQVKSIDSFINTGVKKAETLLSPKN